MQTEKINQIIKRLDSSFFCYDLDHLESRLNEFQKHTPDFLKLWYACKANPHSAILKILRNKGFGVDVASAGELSQALNVGIPGHKLIATGPAKSKNYLKLLIENDVQNIVIESENQLRWLNELARELNRNIQVLLRVQLDWNGGESVLGGDTITPFGLGINDWKNCYLNQYTHLQVVGFHVFQWGNLHDVDKLSSIWDRSIKQILELANHFSIQPEIIDLGGGLGISYNQNQQEISFEEATKVLTDLKNKYNLNQIWLELGRTTVGSCGKYFTKIVDIKTVRGKNIIVTEGGINHIARPALTKESFPAKIFSKDSENKKNFSVHGPLCTSLDFLGEYSLPDNVSIGDWVEFSQTGAYGFTESMPYFLCHEQAAEAIMYKGDLMIPRLNKKPNEWMN